MFGRHLVKVQINNPIVFGIISSHQFLVGGRDILGVMSDFDSILMKFGMKIQSDVLNNFLEFGRDQSIRRLALTRTKKFR